MTAAKTPSRQTPDATDELDGGKREQTIGLKGS
jgi:hypothetical protein